VQPPNGGAELVYPSPVNDATGQYHQDVYLPTTSTPGTWAYRWVSSGSTATDGVSEGVFLVKALSF
jgi:hypothetical protein